jgi:FMN reductase
MSATTYHHLGIDWHLRDVLAWFGAIVAPTSVYLSSSDFAAGNLSDDAKRDLTSLVNALLKLKEITPAAGEYLGPRPLAARQGK